jgi:hypothetical protein
MDNYKADELLLQPTAMRTKALMKKRMTLER